MTFSFLSNVGSLNSNPGLSCVNNIQSESAGATLQVGSFGGELLGARQELSERRERRLGKKEDYGLDPLPSLVIYLSAQTSGSQPGCRRILDFRNIGCLEHSQCNLLLAAECLKGVVDACKGVAKRFVVKKVALNKKS